MNFLSDFKFKENYNINDLVEIVKILRSENGCPWDKEQDHHSIRKDFLEETYEVLEAIDNDDTELLREELGDVLLQVVFHSQIETENNSFTFDDVADEVCKKLITRHPHVFGDLKVDNSEQVLKNWDNIKKKTKEQKTYKDTLESVPKVLPALMRSYKVAQRAERTGMSVIQASPLDILIDEKAQNIDKDIFMELIGNTLLSFVNFARKVGVDPEEALQKATDNYINQFGEVEEIIRLDGKEASSLSIDELDAIWQKVQKK
ncbi:MAG: nucleoside triphosphate pyrophosphohydrolase [Oscillospiraceae bacterium]